MTPPATANPLDPPPKSLHNQKITARTVAFLTEQLHATAPTDPHRAEHAHQLRWAIAARIDAEGQTFLGQLRRWLRMGSPARRDLPRTVVLAEEAAAASPPSSIQRAEHLAGLRWALSEAWATNRDPDTLDRSLDAGIQALLGPALPLSLENHLADAITWICTQAHDLQPPPTPPANKQDNASRLFHLVKALHAQYHTTNTTEYLNWAIRIGEASHHLTKEHDDKRGDRAVTLCRLLGHRGYWGPDADIDRGIALADEALSFAPRGHPDRGPRLAVLGEWLRPRWRRAHQDTDLERGVALAEEALSLAPPDHPYRDDRLRLISWWLGERWLHESSSDVDLEHVIALADEAVKLTAEDHPDRGPRLCYLSWFIDERWIRHPTDADLDRGTDLVIAGLDIISGKAERKEELQLALVWLSRRWVRDHVEADLVRGLAFAEEALGLAPPGDSSRGERLHRVSWWLEQRWVRDHVEADLVRGLAFAEEALGLAPPGDSSRGERLHLVSWWLRERWVRDHAEADLVRATTLMIESVLLSGPNDPDRLDERQRLLSRCAVEVARLDDGPRLLLQVCEALDSKLSTGGAISTLDGMVSAKTICRLGLELGEWDYAARSAATALSQARDGLAELGSEGYGERWLASFQGVAAGGGYALCRLGRAEEAVELMERGLGMLAAERAGIPERRLELAAHFHPGLVAIYRESRDVLRRRAAEGQPYAAETIALGRARAALEAEVGDLAGSFSYHEVADLARQAGRPIVYLLATAAGGSAVTVAPAGEADAEWIETLTEGAVKDRVNALSEAFEPAASSDDGASGGGETDNSDSSRARPSPDEVVAATLKWLAGLLPSSLDSGAMIVPVGLLGHLPIVASVLERTRNPAELSVAATAELHHRCRMSTTAAEAGPLLAVSNPSPCSPPDATIEPLPQSETAGRMLVTLFRAEHLTGAAATRTNVLARLATSWVLHLGVHGKVERRRFRDSRALLADEDGLPSSLSLQDLIDRIYSHAGVPVRLVYLGACWLGSANRLLPDQNEGFPTALVANGVSGVIAPLWPIHEGPNFDFVKIFYDAWLQQKLSPALAATQAMLAVKSNWPTDSTWAAYAFTGA